MSVKRQIKLNGIGRPNPFKIKIKSFRKWVWNQVMKEQHACPLCFDCGTELQRDDGPWTVFVDRGGILFMCDEHAIQRMELMDTWNRVFERCAKRK